MTESDDVEQLLNREDKREAADWLTSAPPGVDRGIGELDNAESLAFVTGAAREKSSWLSFQKLRMGRKNGPTN